MPRSPVGVGMFAGAIMGFVIGVSVMSVTEWPDLHSLPVILAAGIFLGGVGLVGGGTVGACYNLVAYLLDPGRVPRDGPEADYYDRPEGGGRDVRRRRT